MGKGDPDVRVRVDTHLLYCAECRHLCQQEYPTMRSLSEVIEEAREQLVIPSERLRLVFSRIIAGVRENDRMTVPQIHNGLNRLRALLDPVLGPKIAQRAIQMAGHRASTQSITFATPENWDSFLERLAGIVSVICGDVVAGLIRERGKLALRRTAVV
jgi:hypothetical protein